MNNIKIVGYVRFHNTGRHYSAKGQRIIYAFITGKDIPANAVGFYDIDRGIDGYFLCSFSGDMVNEHHLMSAYDNQGYNLAGGVRDALVAEAILQGLSEDGINW